MTPTTPTMPTTFLAPGQRYVHPAERSLDRQATITRLEPDRFGNVRVAFSFPGGREVVVYVSQVEAAIAVGDLAPVVGPNRLDRC